MKNKITIIILVLIFLAISGIIFNISRKAKAPVGETEEPATEIAQECKIIFDEDKKIYTRPDLSADIFGTLQAGESQVITAITENGWYAFDPASMQAANVGVFRNRYIPSQNQDGVVDPGCTTLPKIKALPATTCFVMADHEIVVYAKPLTTSKPIAILNSGDYIKAIATTGKNSKNYSKYFAEVDSEDGTLEKGIHGYISGADVNFNGHCEELPNK